MSNNSNGPAATPLGPEVSTGRFREATLTIAAFGVVFGDIGTSPIYAVRECFRGQYGIPTSEANILGVLSLMFWALVLVVSVKYLAFVLRANNDGEGGAMALTALAALSGRGSAGGAVILTSLGLFASSLLYGDGMITPAISVLSAVEGIQIATPLLSPYVIPITIAIIVGLFLFQRRGTRGVGVVFGPVMMLWFAAIGALGISSIIRSPSVVAAVNPVYGLRFLLGNELHGFLVLGAVFLVVTGAEALYADIGHFGPRLVRIDWFGFVLPALLLNYFGQGGLLLRQPGAIDHPFYSLAPGWTLTPLVIFATVATVIASQAVISGAFSLTNQAIQLGYLPRIRVIHTSPTETGQIYIPQVNWMLMIATVFLVLSFQDSSRLAAAYGLAITSTMLITTLLFYRVARRGWNWNLWKVGTLIGIFLFVDLGFFAANLSKFLHGGWFPVAVAGAVYVVLVTWKRGRQILKTRLSGRGMSIDRFIDEAGKRRIVRVPGKAIYMSGNLNLVPPALIDNIRHNHAMHEDVAFMTILTEQVPKVGRDEKVEVTDLGGSFWHIVAHVGFMEEPIVPHLLALAGEKGLPFELDEVSFFVGSEQVVPDRHPALPRWQEPVFAYLNRNAVSATAFFHIPPEQVIEIGKLIRI
jgi:KUP system potassium uptake protein